MSDASVSLIATTGFGLEAVVSRELKSLGYAQQTGRDGQIRFAADVSAICRCNLWLRSAERLLLEMGTFEARDFGILFDRTRELPWERWLPKNANFPVTGRSVKSQLHSVPDCQRIVKKAIVERLKSVYGGDWLDESGPKYAIDVVLHNDEATLTIDTSGDGLYKRGYRKLTAKAPLKETVAAALVQLSVWNAERPLIDPFCGSGTILIEAAMLALNQAPGLKRTFAAQSWPQLDAKLWAEARDEARSLEQPGPQHVLIGNDIDTEVLRLARYHATQAGVDDLIHFQQRPFSDLQAHKPYGCLITNPPWGERLGEQREVEQLYRSMFHVLQPLDTWSIFVLTAHPQFESLFGRPATRRRKLYNGKIAATYYQFLGPRPEKRESHQ
ncbi:class I SAM-dependent RNA methyltransferase [bacterium]|nr:class I SAM-dependent RNA methyltransferase [bacterium]